MSEPHSIKDEFPLIAQELIDRLDVAFPDKLPLRRTAEQDIWIAVGSAKVVRFLRNVYEQQHKKEDS